MVHGRGFCGTSIPCERALASADRIIAAVNAAQAISTAEDPDAILRATLDALAEFRPAFWVACLTTAEAYSTRHHTRSVDSNQALFAYFELAQCSGGESRDPVSARVVESGEPLFIPSIEAGEFVRRYVEPPAIEPTSPPLPQKVSVLVVPMRAGDAVLGTLGLYASDAQTEITEEDIVWVQFVADHTALAIEQGRCAKDSRVRLNRLGALDRIVQAVTSTHELSVVLNIVVDRARAVVGIDACQLLRLEASANTLASVASAGYRSKDIDSAELNLHNPLLNQAFDSRRVEYLRSAGVIDDARRRSMFAREGFVAYAAWPLVSEGNLVGALEIFHRSELTLDAETSEFVGCLAAMSALAIQLLSSEQDRREHHRAEKRGQSPDFSPTEWRVLQLVAEGWTNGDIGAQIHLSPSTIKSHVRRILDKSGAANRTDLARRATREGWV